MVGCLIVGGGALLGGIIGGVVGGTIGVIIGVIIGIIVAVILSVIFGDSSSNSSNSSRSSFDSGAWSDSRKNDPHTCKNCGMYLSRGVCRRDDSQKSPSDSCSNWQ
jgi:predicted lipid-binding transport protein (Tim44 family)